MKANSKVKSIVFLAFMLIALLLVISIFQLVDINKKQKQLQAQQAEIERLSDLENYYKNHQPSQGGSDIDAGGDK